MPSVVSKHCGMDGVGYIIDNDASTTTDIICAFV